MTTEISFFQRHPPFVLIRPALGLALFGVALYALDLQLRAYTLAEVLERLHAIPVTTLALTFGLTVLSYWTLTSFDALAIRHLGEKLPYPRVALTSFIASVFSMDLGLSVFGSSAIRYRLYTTWGLSPTQVGGVIAFTALSFWLGVLGLGGPLLALAPLQIPDTLHMPFLTTRPIGAAMVFALVGYLIFCSQRHDPLRIHGAEIPVPKLSMTGAQLAIGVIDWTLASSVLWVLIPTAPGLDFPTFVAIFMLAELLGLISTVPAGLGVFEGVIIALLAPYHPAAAVLGPLLAFRIIYYLLPIFVAVALLGGIEALSRRQALGHARTVLATVGAAVLPRLLAYAVLVSGLLMVIAGSAPAAAWHIKAMRPVVGLPIVEISHVLSVLAGLGLVFLARGILQRVDATWTATLALLAIGITTSILRGSHWLLVAALALLFVSLLPCRSFFYRRTSLLSGRIPGEWVGVTAVAGVGTVWLGLWANAHVTYAHEMWLRFGWEADNSRALRAGGSVVVALVCLGAWRLSRPQLPTPTPATPEELERAARIVGRARRADAHLALLGDKAFLFDDDAEEGKPEPADPSGYKQEGRAEDRLRLVDEGNEGLLMYGISGRSWIAMGDALGPPARRHALAWRFNEVADQHGGWPVFYEVGPRDMPTYLDLGLSLHKLGEDARVDLAAFSLEGSKHKSMRRAIRHCEKAGSVFEIIPPDRVPPLLDDLEAISNAWLSGKRTREKSFSLGSFSRDYMVRQPIALIRIGAKPIAFANLWLGGDHEEISPDLMRYDPETAPNSVMEYLFAQVMIYGKELGYRHFSLGMAPLAGLSQHPLAPLWNRLGAMLFQHGEHFYNFQGLRQYKAKFDPEWEPRYLASPGGLVLPRVLADLSTLISGGVRGVVSR